MPAFPSCASRFLLALAAAAALAGCGTVDRASFAIADSITPYRVEVVQGNFISKEQVDALRAGLTRQQVREALGTPLVMDLFHTDRWDYVFTIRRQGVDPQQRRLTLWFKGDALERFEGDTMPNEADFVATLDNKRKNVRVPVLEASEESLRQFPVTKPAPAPAPAPAAPGAAAVANYPPLEPRHALMAGAPSSPLPRHKVAVAGASGRMGQMLIEAIRDSADCVLSGATDVAASPFIGNDAAAFLGHASGVPVTSKLRDALAASEVLIDFTRPEGTIEHIKLCRELGVNAVIGTTGFGPGQKEQIADAARDIAIVMAPNMSVGVNVTMKLLELAAKSLASGYDIEIIEAHHRHKVDAPSGTALKMGEVIAGALGRDLSKVAVYGREGVTGERDPSTIGFSSIRGGDVVGDHTVLFAGTGERIEITHKAASRATYAQGSLRAVRFLSAHRTGLFDMFDVLGLK